MRRAAALLLALALLPGLAGCGRTAGETAPTESAITAETAPPTAEPSPFVLPYYPGAGVHPLTGENKTNLSIGGLLYEGLFALDEVFTPQEELCASHTMAADGLSWRFVLREGVTFSDGSPLTPADVVAALNQARGSALYAARLAGVTGVTAETGAVVVTLSVPNGNLPALLDIPISKGAGDSPLGTGPYRLAEDGGRLLARPDWWQGKALPRQEIALRTITAADDLIHAFDTREISLVTTDLTGTNSLGYSGSFETMDYPTTVMLYLGFNTARGICRDEGVRRALQYGLDRGAVSTALLARHAMPASLPTSPVAELYDEALAQRLDYAPQALAETLTAGGWKLEEGVYRKGRERLSLTLLVSGDNTDRIAVAELLSRNLTQAGVEITLQKLPWEEYVAALERGEFDLYLGEVRMTADFDPTVLLSAGGALNYGGYTDPWAQELLYAFRGAVGEGRKAAASALYEYLSQHPPFAVVCFKNWSVLTQWKLVSGATPTLQNIFYQFASWKID